MSRTRGRRELNGSQSRRIFSATTTTTHHAAADGVAKDLLAEGEDGGEDEEGGGAAVEQFDGEVVYRDAAKLQEELGRPGRGLQHLGHVGQVERGQQELRASEERFSVSLARRPSYVTSHVKGEGCPGAGSDAGLCAGCAASCAGDLEHGGAAATDAGVADLPGGGGGSGDSGGGGRDGGRASTDQAEAGHHIRRRLSALDSTLRAKS